MGVIRVGIVPDTGLSRTVTLTESTETGHALFVTVQTNVFFPNESLLTAVVARVVSAIMPVPENNDHTPVS